MRKCLPLKFLEPTEEKRRMLKQTYTTFLDIVKETLSCLGGAKSRAQLHSKTYRALRGRHHVASQLIIEATSYAWSARKTIRRGGSGSSLEKCVVRFDRRLFSFKETKRRNPVLVLRASNKRIGLPINRDGAHHRLQEHMTHGWQLTSIIMKKSLRLLAILSKGTPEPPVRANWIGVDVNSPRIATTTVGPGCGVLKQAYFGVRVATRQFNFEKRRAALHQFRETSSRSKAGLKLKRLGKRQRNYVRTSIWLIANLIVQQAETLGANIAVERLGHLGKRRGEWSAKSRRKVNRIPYGFLRHAVRHVAARQGVLLLDVDPRYTSQMCPYCGYTSKANWVGYSYFRCRACGFEANRDRAASLNIALRAAHTQDTSCTYKVGQFPAGSASVS
ncbi:MAG: transposase [Promethearchaeati archaeon SRVP18_Atabeyarchaeia-1]